MCVHVVASCMRLAADCIEMSASTESHSPHPTHSAVLPPVTTGWSCLGTSTCENLLPTCIRVPAPGFYRIVQHRSPLDEILKSVYQTIQINEICSLFVSLWSTHPQRHHRPHPTTLAAELMTVWWDAGCELASGGAAETTGRRRRGSFVERG